MKYVTALCWLLGPLSTIVFFALLDVKANERSSHWVELTCITLIVALLCDSWLMARYLPL